MSKEKAPRGKGLMPTLVDQTHKAEAGIFAAEGVHDVLEKSGGWEVLKGYLQSHHVQTGVALGVGATAIHFVPAVIALAMCFNEKKNAAASAENQAKIIKEEMAAKERLESCLKDLSDPQRREDEAHARDQIRYLVGETAKKEDLWQLESKIDILLRHQLVFGEGATQAPFDLSAFLDRLPRALEAQFKDLRDGITDLQRMAVAILKRQEEHIQVSQEILAIVRRLESLERETPPKKWFIPLPSAYFTGQEEYLARLAAILDAEKKGGITQPAGLRGFGGIGKTELALAYAARNRERYQVGHFMVADSLAALDAGLARIADPNLPAEATQDLIEGLKAEALHELARSERVLLIFDNVDEIVASPEFQATLAALPKAHVLLTCRHRDMGDHIRQIAVQKMDEGVGALYVLRLGLGDEDRGPWQWDDFHEADRADARLVARELDGLPLALHHAGSMVRGESLPVQKVLEDYQANRRRILSNRGANTAATHPDSAQVTVVRAYERLRSKSKAAAELVLNCAFLSSDSISEDLFTQRMIVIRKPLADAIDRFSEVRAVVLQTGLLEPGSSRSSLSIHRVTQAVLQEHIQVDLLLRLKARLRIFFRSLLRRRLGKKHEAESPSQETLNRWLDNVTNRAVLTLYAAGRYQEAISHAEFGLAERSRLVGARHPSTLTSMNNLASTYSAMGRNTDALALEEETLAARREALGPRHPDTLTSMNNLASTYSAMGRHGDALALKEETLAARREALGPRHPDTLTSMGNLASTYSAMGRHGDALALEEETLAARREALGPRHPDTLTSMGNLASTYSAMGRHGDALALEEETLAARREALGPRHPDTLTSMGNLASTYSAMGRNTDALALEEETLAARREALGPRHPDTLTSMGNLASTYSAMGRHGDALALEEETLAARREALGPRHPDTLGSMNNLAATYSAMGRHGDALALEEETLAAMREALGPRHPDTLGSMNNLAATYWVVGRRPEAVTLMESAATGFTDVLGADHPSTKQVLETHRRYREEIRSQV